MSLFGQLYYGLGQSRMGFPCLRVGARWARAARLVRGFYLPIEALRLEPAAAAPLMRLWSRIHWSGGDGMMPPRQLLAIYELAVEWPVEGDIVELGAWTGATTCHLAAACEARGGGRVIAVDTFDGQREGGGVYEAVNKYGGCTRPAFDRRAEASGFRRRIRVIPTDTAAAAEHYFGDPIRLLFIDADHSFEGVQRDFEAWLPHVAPGGLILFHDYAMPEAGVRKFVEERLLGDTRIAGGPGVVADNLFGAARNTKDIGEGKSATDTENFRRIQTAAYTSKNALPIPEPATAIP